MNNQYYTASQAIAKLGLSKAMFHRKVNQGLIPKVTPPGKKQSVYPKRDIDALARAMNLIFEQHDRIVFSRSTPADQEEEMQIGIRCFGQEFITPLPERIAFQQKNEFTFWSLKVDGQVVGYTSMFRFPLPFLEDLLTGRRIEREITVKEVLPFTRLEPFNIYIDVMAVDPKLPPHLRRLYAGIIVSRLAALLLDLLTNGYFIQTVYTVSATKEGDKLVRKAGFRLMKGKSVAPGRIAYDFPLDEQGVRRLQELSGRGA
ncbi:MAG: helix-turn-helix domain-containing protein [Ktedonobacteraceae bacterium]|nr:helix-turn-helix domain-containing protein [Ktedonobacteraceae bacterium]